MAVREALMKERPDVAFGIGIIAIASSIGTLRFGVAPRTFAYANGLLAEYGGMMGCPLIGIGFMIKNGFVPETLLGVQTWVGTAALLFCIATYIRGSAEKPQSELYTTLVCVISFIGMLYSQWDVSTVSAVATFISAGLLVGADRHRYILGVRRENIFHYILGSSMVLFARAL